MTTKHPSLDRKKDLYLKETKAKGRGVFCRTAIKKGETLEVTPAIILNGKETDLMHETILSDYVFSIGKLEKKTLLQHKVTNKEDLSCVVMGITSYCNHDTHPNAEVSWQEVDGSLYYVLEATADIAKGSEICTSYGDSWFDDR